MRFSKVFIEFNNTNSSKKFGYSKNNFESAGPEAAAPSDRILYMKRLPSSITEEEVMSLDPDIQKVLLDDSKNHSNTKYALLLFEDSKTAKGALSRLKGVIIDECNIVVDVLNELKSVSCCQVSDFPLAPTKDPKKLYVTEDRDDDDDNDDGGCGENDNDNNGNENIKAAGRISS
ncbi:hypothetical protein HELRODRAFT_161873 [Helobdella robusta]|uniref:RRM domain-containing protein n=1 Tax=Helobdella robusta TaxID=6412 RepID=T1ERZ7_HELRO|nr:hypothetical protein HELRODRAFT_161873 [Helobdella robusta]ESO02585.1 hypothetical protein HELRODRAFT_161873 [Helobdella robusta]